MGITRINERDVALRSSDSTFSTLKDFMDRRIVKRMPWVESQELSIVSAQHSLIDSSVLSGTIAVGTSSTSSGSYIGAELVGATGTAGTTYISDDDGNILNLVQIRDAETHDELKEGVGDDARSIYGLIQCSNGTADGATIGGLGSENLQISFVYYASDGTLTLATAFTNDIEFQANKLVTQRKVHAIEMENGRTKIDILDSNIEPTKRGFTVTNGFDANEVITLSTGSGASAGTSTTSGDTLLLQESNALFNDDNTTRVKLNGVEQRKGSGNDFIWDSTDSGHFTFILDIGDYFTIERIIT